MPQLTRLVRSITAAVALAVLPAALAAQGAGRALVYCPIGLDETGCGNIAAALDAPGATFAGAVDRGYDGTGGTVDLATADLSIYRVVLVPSLSDGATGRPYDRLRDATVAARLRAVLTGRRAVWSGTPDLGTGSTAEKTTLIASLAAWAAGGSGAGLIALLDNSEDPATRYDWLAGIGALSVGADTTVASYDSVQALSAIATGVLAAGGTPLAYPNMAAFGVHAGSGASEDARGLNADGTAGGAVLVTAADGSATAPASPPASAPSGAKAMVYCPVAADGPACDNIVAALTAAGTPFTAVDRAYDGSSGTLDLRNADLGGYAVLVVPSLADGATAQPYALLRDPAVAARLKPLLLGPVAIWSGTPDLGTTNVAQKSTLLLNLARWAAAQHASSGLEGLVALQDASDDVTQRYGWVNGISHVSVAGDSTFNVHDNVQVVTTTGTALLDNGLGLQLGYSNMASWGLILPQNSGLGADATGGRTSQIVLASSASAGGGGAVAATITTDKQDYAPGETVTITGSGWAPGETVNFVLHEDPTLEADIKFSGVVDAGGKVVSQSFTPDAQDLGVRFVLTATGAASGRVAQATFTDGTPQIDAVSPTPFSPTQPSSAGVKDATTITVKNQGGGTVNGITARVRSGTLLTGTLVREITVGNLAGNGTANVVWDGRDVSAVPVADGLYTVRAFSGTTEENGTGRTQAVVVDNTNPTTSISSPSTGTTGAAVTITGTASDQPAIAGAGIASVVVTILRTADNAVLSTGAASNAGSWSYSYTPSEASAQTVTAKVTDNAGNTFTTAGASLLVKAPNHAPVANNDSYNAVEDQVLTVTVPGVLGNDTDADGDVLAAAVVSGPTSGSLTLNANGSLTYTPNANFFGTDQFTYRASDGTVSSAVAATVTLNVAAVNDPPSFVKGPDQTVTEGAGAQSVSPWTTAISAGPNEGTQTVTFVVSNDNNALFSVQPSVASNGTLTYTPALVANGVATVTVTAKDDGGTANGGIDTSAPQTFTVTVKPKSPTALTTQPATGTFGGGAALSATLTSGVSPVSGKTISFRLNGTSAGSATTDATGTASIASASLTGINGGSYPAGANSGVQADFAGDPSFAASSAGNTLTVNKAAATMKVTINGGTSASVPFGSTVQLTGNLTPNLNGETITFDINGTVVGSMVTSNGGVANLNVSLASFPALVASATAYTVTGTVTTSPANPNFTFGTGTAPLTITQAAATLAFGTTTFVYDGSPKPVTVTTTPAGLTGVSITYAASTTAPTDAGSYALVASLTNPNFTAPTINGTLLINKADQTITFTPLVNRTFGDAPLAVSATATSTLAVTFAVGATDNCTIAGVTVTITGAGSCTVTASQAGDNNHNPAPSVPQTFTVGKATPVIAWNNPSPITFGTALGATQLNAVVTGVGGVLLPGASVYTPAAGTLLSAGNAQSLSVLFTPTDAANYTTATKNVTIDVQKFTPVALVTGTTITYDKNPHGATAFSVTGANNEDLTASSTLSYAGTGTTTYGPSATPPTNAGSYQVTISYPGSSNYGMVSAQDPIVINRAAPTIAWATPAAITYGVALSGTQLNAAATGINGEAVSGTFAYSPAAGAVLHVTGAPHALATAFTSTDPNYSDVAIGAPTNATVTLVVSPAPITVTADAQTKVYGDNDPALTSKVTSGALVGADQFSGALTRVAGETVAGGPYAIQQGTLTAGTDYVLTYEGAALTITRAPLAVVAGDAGKVFGDGLPALTGAITGIKNGDNITATYTAFVAAGGMVAVTATTGVAGSPYPIIPSVVDPDGRLANYLLTQTNGKLTVTRATPAFSNLSSPSVIFGTASTTLGGTLSFVGTGATVVPAGGHIVVGFNGSNQTVAVANDGSFSASFPTGTVDVLGNPYPITYRFNNDESPDNFTAATDGAGALTIIDQTAPLTSNVLATPNPVAFGTNTQLAAQISDAGRGSSTIISAAATITGGSIVGSQTQTLTLGGGTFTRSAATTLSLPTGVYSVCVTGTDAANNVSAPECTLLAVYDASAGFVTGGGWINSPAGASAQYPAAVGKANFGFVSKYQKGATVPTGDTEFQFQAGNLNFKSTAYQWLVIAGAKAQYKGNGTINGAGSYSFILTATDGDQLGGGTPDKFRIKITDGSGGIVYDNQMGASDTSDPTTALSGGSIVVHK